MNSNIFKTIISTGIMVCALAACTKAQLISDLPEDINKPEDGSVTATTAKRGVCQSTNTANFGEKLVGLKANWYYTWGLDPSSTVEGVEFVPMFWSGASVTEDNCNKINRLFEEGKISYVLGFNEPDDHFSKGTHCVDLTESTIQANSRLFDRIEDVPRQAYTMGTQTIMYARQILVIANGEAKAQAVRDMCFGPVTPSCPASILQLHTNCVVVADEAALSLCPTE